MADPKYRVLRKKFEPTCRRGQDNRDMGGVACGQMVVMGCFPHVPAARSMSREPAESRPVVGSRVTAHWDPKRVLGQSETSLHLRARVYTLPRRVPASRHPVVESTRA